MLACTLIVFTIVFGEISGFILPDCLWNLDYWEIPEKSTRTRFRRFLWDDSDVCDWLCDPDLLPHEACNSCCKRPRSTVSQSPSTNPPTFSVFGPAVLPNYINNQPVQPVPVAPVLNTQLPLSNQNSQLPVQTGYQNPAIPYQNSFPLQSSSPIQNGQGGYQNVPIQRGYQNVPIQNRYQNTPDQNGYQNVPVQKGYQTGPAQTGTQNVPVQNGYLPQPIQNPPVPNNLLDGLQNDVPVNLQVPINLNGLFQAQVPSRFVQSQALRPGDQVQPEQISGQQQYLPAQPQPQGQPVGLQLPPPVSQNQQAFGQLQPSPVQQSQQPSQQQQQQQPPPLSQSQQLPQQEPSFGLQSQQPPQQSPVQSQQSPQQQPSPVQQSQQPSQQQPPPVSQSQQSPQPSPVPQGQQSPQQQTSSVPQSGQIPDQQFQTALQSQSQMTLPQTQNQTESG